MNTTLPKLFMIVLSVYFNVSCYIGTQRDSCRYNLKENGAFGPSPDSCELLQLTAGLPLPNDTAEMIQSRGETLNFLLLNCYRYYERLQECNKEENRFIPSIYGINSNPASDTFAQWIAGK
ncbi:hypothetical protein JWG44_10745 [Leptospira sp. 201903071]|uniref:hypothetical protein n=1 Tax=Leptospira ainazelensis TaxID=2810034 RepID=UPI001963083A|nr:hypothetical protein [Leptospira ainazelensis]MBM9500720.1 hypothetical protein [Leptospira ainazelensis]MBM9500723.1 hypothetical protein [Leptospira ainazelensis]